MCVKLQWFAHVPEDEDSFDKHKYLRAARCKELILTQESSWVTVEDIVGIALVQHVCDIQNGAAVVEGISHGYVIQYIEAGRKRKKNEQGKKVAGFLVEEIKEDEWAVIPEASDVAIDRFDYRATHGSTCSMHEIVVRTMRRLIQVRTSPSILLSPTSPPVHSHLYASPRYLYRVSS